MKSAEFVEEVPTLIRLGHAQSAEIRYGRNKNSAHQSLIRQGLLILQRPESVIYPEPKMNIFTKLIATAHSVFWQSKQILQSANAVLLGLLLLASCTTSTSIRDDRIWLGHGDSELVHRDQVSRYGCSDGLLIVERLSSRQRKVVCGTDATSVLLR